MSVIWERYQLCNKDIDALTNSCCRYNCIANQVLDGLGVCGCILGEDSVREGDMITFKVERNEDIK